MIVRKFQASDLYSIQVKTEQTLDWGYSTQHAKFMEGQYSFTGVDDEGNVIACAGLMPLFPGVGSIWAMFSDELPKHKLAVIRELRKHLKHLQDHDYFRMETVVRKDHPTSLRFIEAVGFKRTGDKERYAFGLDFWEYSLVKEE